MLFMTIYTYEPDTRDEIIKRRLEKGPMSEGLKIIGEWSYIGSGCVFRLVECDDMKTLQAAIFPWTDLGKVEIFPVMEVEEVLKLISGD